MHTCATSCSNSENGTTNAVWTVISNSTVDVFLVIWIILISHMKIGIPRIQARNLNTRNSYLHMKNLGIPTGNNLHVSTNLLWRRLGIPSAYMTA